MRWGKAIETWFELLKSLTSLARVSALPLSTVLPACALVLCACRAGFSWGCGSHTMPHVGVSCCYALAFCWPRSAIHPELLPAVFPGWVWVGSVVIKAIQAGPCNRPWS